MPVEESKMRSNSLHCQMEYGKPREEHVEEHLLNAEEKMDVSWTDDAWLSTGHFLASVRHIGSDLARVEMTS
jgi:hypothetical protein